MLRLLAVAAALITTHADETVTLKRDAPADEPEVQASMNSLGGAFMPAVGEDYENEAAKEAERVRLSQAAEQAERDRAEAVRQAEERERQRAADAERERQEAERSRREADERRAADVAHRKQINQGAIDALVAAGVPEKHARLAITEIGIGNVPNVRITY